MKWLAWLRYAITGGMLALLAGCTTYVAKVNKDESYDKRLADTNVLWIADTKFQVRVSRTGQGYKPFISEKDKADAQQGTAELLLLFAKSVPTIVGSALTASQVTVTPTRETASTQLRIRPIGSDTDCAPLGCVSSLWVEAALYDRGRNKVVWSGAFKVGAPFPMKNDEAVVENFTKSLINELKSSRLL